MLVETIFFFSSQNLGVNIEQAAFSTSFLAATEATVE